ncbi:SDR family NAD(P)-dependent oxidoreductase [Streptomyces rhizosphaericola]|uniref:SDR family NAD(P)-dependent oxidoreductase n=1 Tax=Streptomyces rhizosphaericola TaxID=2564098 RepID=UPI0030B894FC
MIDRRRFLSGRTAVVTGGARGLGKAIAEKLAARGVNVVLLGLEGNNLARIATGLPTASRSWVVGIIDDAMVHAAQDGHDLMAPFRSSSPTQERPKSALSATQTVPMMNAYCASKAAVESFTHSLRTEMAHSAVTCRRRVCELDRHRRDPRRRPVQGEGKVRSLVPRPARAISSAEHVVRRVVTPVERHAYSVYVPG